MASESKEEWATDADAGGGDSTQKLTHQNLGFTGYDGEKMTKLTELQNTILHVIN